MNAQWLAPNGCESEKNCYFRAVKIIYDENPESIDIAVESYYILYINGIMVKIAMFCYKLQKLMMIYRMELLQLKIIIITITKHPAELHLKLSFLQY